MSSSVLIDLENELYWAIVLFQLINTHPNRIPLVRWSEYAGARA